MLRDHAGEINMFGLSVANVQTLLDFVLKSNYLKFGEQLYRQVEGVAMGNNLALPFAILFMHALETRLLDSSPLKLSCTRGMSMM